MKLNMNDQATVHLTEHGRIVYDYFNRHMLEVARSRFVNDTLTMPLWELFQIFGESLGMARPVPFVDNVIEIEEAK